MTKQVKLTVAGIESRRKKGMNKLYSDAGCRCLYLKTTEAKTASWIFRWKDRITGKLRDLGLGTVDETSLADARQLAGDLHKLVREGGDPIAQRHRKRQERIAAAAKVLTFDQCAMEYISTHAPGWRNPKHRQQWERTLAQYATPVIGSLSVDQIELPHVLNVLKPIWEQKTETATRIRGRIESVLAWATVSGYRTGDNPARWRGNLDQLLPKPSKVRKVTHHAALPWQQINPFMMELRGREGIGARALEFAILTATRSGEVRLARWNEIDLQNALWRVPGERMKGGKDHTIPLSASAVKVLKAITPTDSPYVFPAVRGGALSDMTLSAVTRRMGVDAVPHGFRSSFKDWARSSTGYADEVSELALAHVNNDATRAAYARDELIPKRTLMMRDWAKYIERKPTQDANVTSINKATA